MSQRRLTRAHSRRSLVSSRQWRSAPTPPPVPGPCRQPHPPSHQPLREQAPNKSQHRLPRRICPARRDGPLRASGQPVHQSPDGHGRRAVIRTVPRITLRGLQRSDRARLPMPCSYATASARRTPLRSTERESADRPCGTPRVVPQVHRCSSSPGVSCEDGSDLVPGGRCVEARRSGVAAAYRQKAMLRSTNPFERWRGCSRGRQRVKCSTAP